MSDPSGVPTTATAVALATLTEQVSSLNKNVEGLRSELRDDRKTYVQHSVWEQRNKTVDANLAHQGREIGQLRTDLASRRAPWWSTWAVVLSAGALAWSVLGPAIRG